MTLSRREMIQRMAVLGVGVAASDAVAQNGVGRGGGGTGRGMGPRNGTGASAGRPAPVPIRGKTWGLNGATSFGEYKQSCMRAGKPVPPVAVSPDNPAILFHEYLCASCGHCDEACLTQGVAHRFDPAKLLEPNVHPCIHCGQCTNQCKRGGMTERFDFPRFRRMAEMPSVILVASTSPAVRGSLGECFGEEPETISEGRMVSALRAIGFQYVLDTTFAADLTVMEEASELVKRLKAKQRGETGDGRPIFTSCCPGWVSFAEQFYPQFLPNLASTKSPVMMQGAVVKTWFAQQMKLDPRKIVHVAITPCTAKKYEVQRPEMNAAGRACGLETMRDVDGALTCREVGQWIYESRVKWDTLPESEFDSLMGRGSGAGVIFGNTGGVTESTLRTTWYLMTNEKPPQEFLSFEPVRGLEGVKETSVEIGDVSVNVAVVSGSGNLRPLLDAILAGEKRYDFVEVMACPGGCIGGGGQPKPNGNGRPTDELRTARIAGLYTEDQTLPRRCSFENSEVKAFYDEFAGEPLGDVAEALLHTTYTDRKLFRG